jgi:radical SAM protein with 4Fe4S-binding SPASM domain
MKKQPIKDCLGTESDDLNRYLAKAAVTRTPLSVSFELTHRCNFRCVHCYLGDQEAIRQHRHQELGTDSVIRLLDELAEAGTLFLTLTGGDPMLRPDFVRIYEHAVRSGLLVSVYCNGSLITDAVIESFIRYPPRVIEITLYGATEKTFEAITQKPGSFAACMDGIARLRSAGVRLRLKTMVMTMNRHELTALWRTAEEMGVQFRHDCSLIPVLPHSDNGARANTHTEEPGKDDLNAPLRFRLSPEQAAAADFSSEKVREKLQQVRTGETSTPAEQPPALYQCGAGRFSCHITPYGRVQPCIISVQSYADMTEKLHFQDAWDTVGRALTAQEVREDFPCIDCQEHALCTGCPSAFLLETGDTQTPASFYCTYAGQRKKQTVVN